MPGDDAPLFSEALPFIFFFCAVYFSIWATKPNQNDPIKHTAIALSLSIVFVIITAIMIKISITKFQSTSEYLSDVSEFVTEAAVPLFKQLSLFCAFLFAGVAAFVKYGPNISSVSIAEKKGDMEIERSPYENLSEKECTKLKIELLEEMLRVQREKLEKFH